MSESNIDNVEAKIIDHRNNNEKQFRTLEEAKEARDNLIGIGAQPEDLEIVELSTDGSGGSDVQESGQSNDEEQPKVTEPVKQETEPEPTQSDLVDLPERGLNNPLATLPEWMLTEIQHGRNTSLDLNKDGSQVIANALDLSVEAECEVSAKETDFEYCRYRATVETPDGKVFNAVGDARIDEKGKNHNKWDLERKAETRAKKRAVKWATGGGVEAFREFGDGNV